MGHLEYIDFEVIDESKVDGDIFKSTNHGLDADFLKLVDYVFAKDIKHVNPIKKKTQYQVVSSNTSIRVDYSHGLPLFTFE